MSSAGVRCGGSSDSSEGRGSRGDKGGATRMERGRFEPWGSALCPARCNLLPRQTASRACPRSARPQARLGRWAGSAEPSPCRTQRRNAAQPRAQDPATGQGTADQAAVEPDWGHAGGKRCCSRPSISSSQERRCGRVWSALTDYTPLPCPSRRALCMEGVSRRSVVVFGSGDTTAFEAPCGGATFASPGTPCLAVSSLKSKCCTGLIVTYPL